ncbi:MAG: 5-methyltetrahydrofolate--homocysteine methyltransferase, partial [Pusillimonas sp.]|nr:5-methyltetrahydrofolate--homocysteine methyltransferase [Pusillimonas sp.]
TFCQLFGLGSTKARPGKEMEAIMAANFLMNADPHGGNWIKFNKAPPKPGEEVRAGGRAGSRSRRRG